MRTFPAPASINIDDTDALLATAVQGAQANKERLSGLQAKLLAGDLPALRGRDPPGTNGLSLPVRNHTRRLQGCIGARGVF